MDGLFAAFVLMAVLIFLGARLALARPDALGRRPSLPARLLGAALVLAVLRFLVAGRMEAGRALLETLDLGLLLGVPLLMLWTILDRVLFLVRSIREDRQSAGRVGLEMGVAALLGAGALAVAAWAFRWAAYLWSSTRY